MTTISRNQLKWKVILLPAPSVTAVPTSLSWLSPLSPDGERDAPTPPPPPTAASAAAAWGSRWRCRCYGDGERPEAAVVDLAGGSMPPPLPPLVAPPPWPGQGCSCFCMHPAAAQHMRLHSSGSVFFTALLWLPTNLLKYWVLILYLRWIHYLFLFTHTTICK